MFESFLRHYVQRFNVVYGTVVRQVLFAVYAWHACERALFEVNRKILCIYVPVSTAFKQNKARTLLGFYIVL